MADACARAAAVTGDADWARGVARAAAWFAGDNDAGVVMWDPVTGGGYDGLEADGREPESRHGVDDRPDLDAAARSGSRTGDRVTVDRLASRLPNRFGPDPSRVIVQLFVPGHDVPIGPEGRASRVVAAHPRPRRRRGDRDARLDHAALRRSPP